MLRSSWNSTSRLTSCCNRWRPQQSCCTPSDRAWCPSRRPGRTAFAGSATADATPLGTQCYPCKEAVHVLEAVEILPISMSIDGDLLHRHLRGYKDDRSEQTRARMTRRLAGLVAVFLHNHRGCVGAYESVVPVPSAERTAVEAIVQRLPELRSRYRPALEVTGLAPKRELRGDRFRVNRDVDGERVLVLDDTFTRGPSIFGAVAALREAGAVIVGPVVLGRHVQPSWGPSQKMVAWLQARPWDEARCCRCDGEYAQPGQLL